MIAKGIMYHFNILNDDQHFGYYYDNKGKTWKDLDKKQMKYNSTYNIEDTNVRPDPIVTVPYFDWNNSYIQIQYILDFKIARKIL